MATKRDRRERPSEFDLDRLTRARRRFWPAVDVALERVGGYAQCVMHPSEYVGRVEREFPAFATDLRGMGFHREPIAALKVHADGRASAGSWVKRASTFADEQLHVTLFDPGNGVEVCAHWEYSWLTHPIKHYRGVGWDTDRGVRTMRDLLSRNGIAYLVD